MTNRTWLPAASLLAAALIVVCPLPAEQVKLSVDVTWVKASDEFKGCVEQIYRGAMVRLRDLAKSEKAGTWCVVLDVDETVLNNVDFQIDLAKAKKGYDRQMWNDWCLKGIAPALPGAQEYCALIRELGGKVVLITNRQNPPLKYSTAKNLDEQGIVYDALLLREGVYEKDGDKTGRRADVEKGDIKTLTVKLPPLKILMLAGDQCDDLYAKGATFESVKDRYAKDFVMIPNPMYGDWANPGVFVETAAPAAPAMPAQPAAAPAARPAGGALTWQEAMNKAGETVTVEAEIIKIYDPEERGQSGPVKLNVDQDFKTSLTICYFKKNKDESDAGFGDPGKYLFKTVRVTGQVQDYKGSKQIMLRSVSDIEVVK
jgi:5'-nucleotidase (lipoprotein e(P4) family)